MHIFAYFVHILVRRDAYANYLSVQVATYSQRVDIYEPEGTLRSTDFLSIRGEDLAAYISR